MGAHYQRAILLFNQGRYEQARQELCAELAQRPDYGRAHAFMGRCLSMLDRPAEARAANEEGVRLAPQSAYTHYMLGLTYQDCGLLAPAERSIREALRWNPRDVACLISLSWVQFRRGDRRGALATVEKGLAIDPQHAECLSHRGMYQRVLKDWRGAEATLRQALRLDPENDHAHANMAWALYFKACSGGRNKGGLWGTYGKTALDEALGHCQEALRLNPSSEFAQTTATAVLLLRPRSILLAVGSLAYVTGLFMLLPIATGGGLRTNPPPDALPADVAATTLPALFAVALLAFSKGLAFLLVRWSRLGKAVLSPEQRRAAALAAVCLAAAAVAFSLALMVAPWAAAAVLALGAATTGPVTTACQLKPEWARKLMTLCGVLIPSVGLAYLAYAWNGDGTAHAQAALAAASWGVAASLLSAAVRPLVEKRVIPHKG